MKIAKVIEVCNECPFARRFNDATANFGCVLVCMKSVRVISRDGVKSHSSNIDTSSIPDWCILEEYKGTNDISFLEE